MIIDDPRSHFVFLYHPLVYMGRRRYTLHEGRPMTNAEVLEHWGKWLVLRDRSWLDALAEKLDPHIEAERIPCVKYDRTPSTNLAMRECVMMVYCDRRRREDVWEILHGLGVRIKAWVTERETMELRMPGAPLLERWMVSRGLDETARTAVRADAQRRLSRVLEHPDEIFEPWEQ